MNFTLFNKALFAIALILAVSISTPAFAATSTTKISQKKATITPVVVAKQYITVADGQNLTVIANSNSTTSGRIFDANISVTNPDLIYPGEVLEIPKASDVLASRSLPQVTPTVVTTSSVINSAPKVEQVANSTPIDTSSAWQLIANCESGGNWSINTGNGFYGGLQFTLSSWQAVGGVGYPNEASASEQIAKATILQSRQGWGAWPVCSVKAGL